MNPPLKPQLRHRIAALMPGFWIMNHRHSKAWDLELRTLMANHKFVLNGGYHASLGKRCMWISNHPYASFQPKNGEYTPVNAMLEGLEVRPSRATLALAMEKLEIDTLTTHGEVK